MSETIDDMIAYTQLDDNVYLRILHSTKPELEDAKKILQNVQRRQLYRIIGQTKCRKHTEDGKVILKKVIEYLINYDGL
jgi:deoxynucleoside triphosphate triphosphohydrolase SAMHD1